MKNYNEVAKCILERRDAYVAKQKKIRKAVINSVVPIVCSCVVLIAGIGVLKTSKASNPDESTEEHHFAVPTPNTDSEIVIDTLDKLNFYAVKRAIAEENEDSNASVSTLSSRQYNLFSVLSSSNSIDIDPNSAFTITMCSYFTANLSNENGFLAKKFGGTGAVEVVITHNNFNNMITFKKGQSYYSCLQTSSTEKAMMFSSDRYVDGFKLVENYDQENFAFTVYFEGDSVVGINTGKSKSNISEYKSDADAISMVDSFCIVSHKKQSFTAKQLENMFSSNPAFVDDGIVLKDGTILFGDSRITDNKVVFVTGSFRTAITNDNIKKVKAIYNEKYGYCIKLDLVSYDGLPESKNMKLYINDIATRDLVVQNEGTAFYIVNLNNKARTSDVFYELTSVNVSDRIGRILGVGDFAKEMPKKIDLDTYTVVSESVDQYFDKYTYDLNYSKTINQNTPDGVITFDGVTFSLPIKVSELIEKGFVITNDYFDYENMSGEIELTSPSGFDVVAYARGLSGDKKDLGECSVTRVNFDCFENWNDALKGISSAYLDFELFGKINKHSTLDEIITELGEPNRIVLTTNRYDKDCTIELVYDVLTASSEYATMYFYVKPISESNTAPDFLVYCSFSTEK